jgi:hypothetical protein
MEQETAQTFRERFREELSRLDAARDTFSSVLARTQSHASGSGPLLKHRELTSLHALYLNALSDAIRNVARVRTQSARAELN